MSNNKINNKNNESHNHKDNNYHKQMAVILSYLNINLKDNR